MGRARDTTEKHQYRNRIYAGMAIWDFFNGLSLGNQSSRALVKKSPYFCCGKPSNDLAINCRTAHKLKVPGFAVVVIGARPQTGSGDTILHMDRIPFWCAHDSRLPRNCIFF